MNKCPANIDAAFTEWLSYYEVYLKGYLTHDGILPEVDLLAVIARSNGWLPLEPGIGSMTIHIQGKEYFIKRTA